MDLAAMYDALPPAHTRDALRLGPTLGAAEHVLLTVGQRSRALACPLDELPRLVAATSFLDPHVAFRREDGMPIRSTVHAIGTHTRVVTFGDRSRVLHHKGRLLPFTWQATQMEYSWFLRHMDLWDSLSAAPWRLAPTHLPLDLNGLLVPHWWPCSGWNGVPPDTRDPRLPAAPAPSPHPLGDLFQALFTHALLERWPDLQAAHIQVESGGWSLIDRAYRPADLVLVLPHHLIYKSATEQAISEALSAIPHLSDFLASPALMAHGYTADEDGCTRIESGCPIATIPLTPVPAHQRLRALSLLANGVPTKTP